MLFMFALCSANTTCSTLYLTSRGSELFEFRVTTLTYNLDITRFPDNGDISTLSILEELYSVNYTASDLVNNTIVKILTTVPPCIGNEEFDFVLRGCVCKTKNGCDSTLTLNASTNWPLVLTAVLLFGAVILLPIMYLFQLYTDLKNKTSAKTFT